METTSNANLEPLNESVRVGHANTTHLAVNRKFVKMMTIFEICKLSRNPIFRKVLHKNESCFLSGCFRPDMKVLVI